jgi:surfeit locus 1 family protein
VALGCWQIHRGKEKARILMTYAKQKNLAATPWNPAMKAPRPYQKVQVQGHLMPLHFLLDNQHYQHQFGYSVLSPLLLADQEILLVDRGFVPGDRQHLPLLDIQEGTKSLQGYAYYPSQHAWVLGPEIEKQSSTLTILERIHFSSLALLFPASLKPFVLRLAKEEPEGFLREWQVVSMPAERHYAYALQWFLMALVLVIGWIVLDRRS